MGVDLWIPHYEFLYGHLSSDEMDFVMERFSQCDDGTYSIDDNKISDLENEMSNKEIVKFGSLLDALYEGLSKEHGYLAVQMS